MVNTVITVVLALVGVYAAFGDKLPELIAWLKSLIGGIKPTPAVATPSREKALRGWDDVADFLIEIGDTDCEQPMQQVWGHLSKRKVTT